MRIYEFAGQALCSQESRGLTHYRAWLQPYKAVKIKKLQTKD
jgi:hypothetical protein